MKTRLSAILFICAALLMVVACDSESRRQEEVKSTTESGTTTASPAAEVKKRDYAFLRVLNAVPGGGAVDVVTDKETPFTATAYGRVTPYKEIHSEQQTIRIVPAGQTGAQPLASNRELVVAGNHYTAIAMPDSDGKKVALYVFDDNLTPPSAGKAKVRVINASPDAGEIDVFAKGNNKSMFSGLNYQSATRYDDIDPMTATLEVRPQGKQNVMLMVPNAKFEAGKIYTVIITGKAKGTPKLEASIVQDELVGAPTSASPMMSPTLPPGAMK